MARILDVLLLLALPASGKSEVRRYLASLSPEQCRNDMHLGPTVQLDDYPYVHMMRRVSQELRKAGEGGVFFDSDDLMQVKYEMLRQVHIDKGSISESAQAFGFSRPSFYQAQAALQQDGVFGLLPHRRGPQGGHKLTAEVMEFVTELRFADSSLTPEQLAEAIQRRFRIQVHPRSIQRRLLRQKKRR